MQNQADGQIQGGTALKKESFIESELKKYNIADATIEAMSKSYMVLTVHNPNDRKGYAVVHEARMEVKGKRVDVEKKRKDLKADAVKFGRAIDGEAKRITALLKPIEDHPGLFFLPYSHALCFLFLQAFLLYACLLDLNPDLLVFNYLLLAG